MTETRAHKTSAASPTLTLLTRHTYDHAGRKTAFYHKINTNAEKQLAKYVYDFRDRLIDKNLDSVRVGSVSSWLQSIDYAYNEQNWLASINSGSSFGALSQDAIALCSTNPGTPNPAETAYGPNPDGNDLFKLDLYYDSPGLTFGSPSPTGQRNGNISQLVWQTRGRQRQGYTLQYDYLDRLTAAYYADGNLTSDPYKGVSGMTVTYNHLNLPVSMNFGSNGTLGILYDHTGKKLRKTVSPTTTAGYTQDYVNGLEYRTNSGGGTLTLEAIYHAEGRITPLSGSNYQYEYTISDHLGNARLCFADLNANGVVDVPGDILQENHYYPFGMNMNYGWLNAAALDNRYQYNGKELNDDFGLNWSDYGARWYEASVGRWWSVDPLAVDFPSWCTYLYTFNNPIRFIDPEGRAPAQPDDWYLNKSTGAITWINGSGPREGLTHLGEDLQFIFNSYIDGDLWDGPGGTFPVGDKLTSTITFDATQDAMGNLLSVNAVSSVEIGMTGGLAFNKGRDYFPGLGENQNQSVDISGANEFSATFEQHASVPGHEAFGLSLLGYDIVNVAQKLDVILSKGNLQISASTDIFPSATLSVNSNQLLKYDQPSFKDTHGRTIQFTDESPTRIESVSRRPAPAFYNRFKN